MLELFSFISRKRVFIIFVLLEVLSFYFLVNNNNYWGVAHFNTANAITGRVVGYSNTIKEYTNLRQINTSLAEENRRLNEQLTFLQQKNPKAAPPTYHTDSAFASRFRFVLVAKVIEATTRHPDNLITIDKGTADGVKVGMGVVTPTGIVGKVKICNERFSIITSILHSQSLVSTKLARSGEIGSVKWLGIDPAVVSLNDVSRYKKVMKGDTALTSDFNSVFPPGMMIGYVQKVGLKSNLSDLDITVRLSTDFTKLSFVYLVDNQLEKIKDNLSNQLIEAKK